MKEVTTMNYFEQSNKITDGLRKSFHSTDSKMANRVCYGYTTRGTALVKLPLDWKRRVFLPARQSKVEPWGNLKIIIQWKVCRLGFAEKDDKRCRNADEEQRSTVKGAGSEPSCRYHCCGEFSAGTKTENRAIERLYTSNQHDCVISTKYLSLFGIIWYNYYS